MEGKGISTEKGKHKGCTKTSSPSGGSVLRGSLQVKLGRKAGGEAEENEQIGTYEGKLSVFHCI